MKSNCEYCAFYVYDEDYDCYVCDQNLDEDDMQRFRSREAAACPFFRDGDEYRMVKKQM